MGGEKHISALKCCVLQAQDGQALKKLVTLFASCRIRNHWLIGHAPEVTAIIAVLYAATTAYSRNDSFLPL